MPKITSDLIEGTSVSEDKNGIKAVRAFLVEDSSGMAEALSSTPAVFDFHPDYTTIQVVSKSVTPLGPSTYKVSVNYEPIESDQSTTSSEEDTTINIGAAVAQVTSNKDVDGNTVTIKNAKSEKGDKLEDKSGLFEVYRPQTSISFSRRENSDGGKPKSDNLDVIGKINNAPFFGYVEKSVLCTGVQAVSNDGGVTYQTTYEFQINPNLWVIDLIYTDEDGNPRADATIGNGQIVAINVYEQTDFRDLNLY